MEPVRLLNDGTVLVDWGPMTLTIAAWAGDEPLPVVAAQAARVALRCLATLARFQGYLRRPVRELPPDRPLPAVVARAARAARSVEPSLTPLAAVAGAVADQVAEYAWSLGAERVAVNNGGDVALRLAPGQRLRVGVRAPDGRMPGRLTLRGEHGVGGVASSGWQGRSFSPGVADIATAWASCAAVADAAATVLAGAVSLDGPGVSRRPARELDPHSDLGRTPVTTAVHRLTPPQHRQALARGGQCARRLHAAGLIRGCLLCLGPEVVVLDPAPHLLRAA